MSELFKKEQAEEAKDRVLGDEWKEWDGKGGGTIKTSKGLFLTFAGLFTVIFDLALIFLLYMTSPRLITWWNGLPTLLGVLVFAFVFVTIVWMVQLIVTAATEKNVFINKKQAFIAFDFVFNNVFKLSRLFSVSRDTMGHSFVLVSNAISRALATETTGKVMVLLPRCMKKEQIKEIYDLRNKYPIDVYTVSGGELARKKVKENRPSAIVGVACERDLVSAIKDVSDKIPVIGIPNLRPEGPCKNTEIDMEKLYEAVNFYCSKISTDLPSL